MSYDIDAIERSNYIYNILIYKFIEVTLKL